MDKCFSKSVCNILKVAEKEMLECHHPYVGTEHLLLSLLKNHNISSLCYKYELTYDKFKNELIRVVGKASKKSEVILYTPLLKIVIDNAYNKAYDDHKDLDEFYLLSSLLNEDDGIALRIVSNMGVDTKSLIKEVNKPNLLYELGICLNDRVSDRVYLRDNEINEIMQILIRKNKNNPLLIGHSGVGKTAIVEELAHRLKEGKVPDMLKGYEIFLINTSSLIAGTKYRGEFESRVNELIKEVIKSKNNILFIDEIHTLVKTGASDGSIDAANILKPYLARGEIKVIGATTIDEYNEYIKKDAALVRRFTSVMINEPSLSETKYILNKVKKVYEKHYNLVINKSVINYILENTSKYFTNMYNPDKSIELLDTSCARKILLNNDNILSKKDIDISLNNTNKNSVTSTKLSNIFNELKLKYSESDLKEIIKLIRKNDSNKRLIISNNCIIKGNIISELASKLSINLISIDCRDYNDEYSINKLINNNYLYNMIEENPYSFIIFKNYNDSNRILYNVINTMINNGYISNYRNEKVFLNNVVIFIMNDNKVNKIGFNNLLIHT